MRLDVSDVISEGFVNIEFTLVVGGVCCQPKKSQTRMIVDSDFCK